MEEHQYVFIHNQCSVAVLLPVKCEIHKLQFKPLEFIKRKDKRNLITVPNRTHTIWKIFFFLRSQHDCKSSKLLKQLQLQVAHFGRTTTQLAVMSSSI